LAMQRGYVIYLYIMVEECLMVKSDSTWKYCNIHGMWYIQ
jgi:desulfoferrodoxin (superoxide reductase-like protein)